jgi:hypothetical protein
VSFRPPRAGGPGAALYFDVGPPIAEMKAKATTSAEPLLVLVDKLQELT